MNVTDSVSITSYLFVQSYKYERSEQEVASYVTTRQSATSIAVRWTDSEQTSVAYPISTVTPYIKCSPDLKQSPTNKFRVRESKFTNHKCFWNRAVSRWSVSESDRENTVED
jgi:hypothetical protein